VPSVVSFEKEASPDQPAGFRLDTLLGEDADALQASLAERVVQPRCPACRMTLVARMCRAGPRFPCRCRGHEAD
jgi:hypothetical protein